MNSVDFPNTFWRYYLIIEADFMKVSRYIEFDDDNMSCHSIEFVRLYQTICSEFEAVCKEYCKYINNINGNTSKADKDMDMNYYKQIIPPHNKLIQNIQVEWRNLHKTFTPLNAWDVKPPDWWKLHQKVKHNRNTEFKLANLENTINSLAGLYVLELSFYKELHTASPGIPLYDSDVFNCPDFANIILSLIGGVGG